MASAKEKLVTILKSSAEVKALLGGPNVFYEYPDQTVDTSKLSAWVIYYETDNRPEYADGREYFVEAVYQVDVISRKSTTAIAAAVVKALTDDDFERQLSTDTVEDDGDKVLYVKSMQFRIMMEV